MAVGSKFGVVGAFGSGASTVVLSDALDSVSVGAVVDNSSAQAEVTTGLIAPIASTRLNRLAHINANLVERAVICSCPGSIA